jgi:phosphopantothenoylcysteine decarboxylase/phosphopantothenate--cysteine ligase
LGLAAVKRVLLIITGGIAAYKALELIRLLKKSDYAVTCVLTEAGAQFVTPLSVQALSGTRVYTDLWSLTDESEMGHIELSRSADLVVVAPATANILAAMAAGLCGDLASTLLLATDKPVLVAPAMNVRMWEHAATQANLATLKSRGVAMVQPDEGPMACGEYGVGRLAAPEAIFAAIESTWGGRGALAGRRAIVTSGPTHEPIDPVRYLANRSSGRQGHAIAAALAAHGAAVTLCTGPVAIADPAGVRVVHVQTAAQMLAAVQAALPADIAVFAAAVADWHVEPAPQKLKKTPGATGKTLTLGQTTDILAHVAGLAQGRPLLVVGFAAETENLAEHAQAKRARKGCDWILANDVGGTGIMGGADNEVLFVSAAGTQSWPRMGKAAVAEKLVQHIESFFA